ncbi:MAG: HAD family hydrolase [Sporomusa sp.]
MKIIFWDIDGTLIRTARASLFAFEQAVAELYCREIDFAQIMTHGVTDNHIAAQIIQYLTNGQPSAQDIARITKRYEQLLPDHLAARTGLILPAVLEILEYLQSDESCVSLLLTGNSHCGAQIKLDHFNLAQYFNFDASAFCGHRVERNDIAEYALKTVTALYPNVKPDELFVIGDTPNDIACGKAIGAKTIAVATGNYSVDSLAAHEPWWAVTQLPDPSTFTAKLASN